MKSLFGLMAISVLGLSNNAIAGVDYLKCFLGDQEVPLSLAGHGSNRYEGEIDGLEIRLHQFGSWRFCDGCMSMSILINDPNSELTFSTYGKVRPDEEDESASHTQIPLVVGPSVTKNGKSMRLQCDSKFAE